MYLTQPRFCFRDRSRMPVCPLAPGTPFALQAQKRELVFLDPAVRRDPADAFHVHLCRLECRRAGRPGVAGDGWCSGCHNSRCCEKLETTHELQSRALQIGPTPMTSSEMMTASSTGASLILVGRSAKQLHSSVIAGSCTLSVAHQQRA